MDANGQARLLQPGQTQVDVKHAAGPGFGAVDIVSAAPGMVAGISVGGASRLEVLMGILLVGHGLPISDESIEAAKGSALKIIAASGY